MRGLRSLPVVLLVLAVVAGTYACASGGTTSGTSTTTQTISTTTTTETAVTIPDGTQFGFVHRVADGTLSFDPAEFLDAEAGVVVARADGAIGPDEGLSDPFYIHNPKVEDVRLQVDPTAQFTLLAYDSTGTPLLDKTLSYDELAHLWANGDDDEL